MATLTQLKCVKCGWSWTPRLSNPKVCPRCKSYSYRENGEKA